MNKNLVNKLEEYYKSRIPNRITEAEHYVYASVAVIMNNGHEILFIKRPENPKDPYSGHVAFPGGKNKTEDESLLFTAIREVKEEVGINLEKDARIIGELDQLKPLNPEGPKYIVTPFFAVLEKENKIVINDEVENFIWIPLKHLLDNDNMRVRLKERSGQTIEDFVYKYENYIIWGMTGRIINSFVNDISVIL
ncbi:MAG: NUDIX hydrolase [Thermodesulfobacteriota bacterium]